MRLPGEVGVSRFYFLRLFKTSLGLSPHAYLMMRRLELAKHLIQQGETLAQAALRRRVCWIVT